jgi:hypothetical protein
VPRRRTRATRRRTTRGRRNDGLRISGRLARELAALGLVVLAVAATIALFAPDAGYAIRALHTALTRLLGWGIAFAPPLLAGFALMLWMKSMRIERHDHRS